MAAAMALTIAKPPAPACARKAARKSGEDVETFVVSGIHPSLAKSLETNREFQTVIDVLAAEDVGKFPDKKVAESLQRVSGVSISREFGEGERVSRLAAARRFNNLTLPI